MTWKKQFDIIWQKTKQALAAQGEVISNAKFESFLEVSVGKAQSWKKGQRPSADDLESIARKLNLSPAWLLLGEGEPEAILEAADGRIAGDLLFDLVLGRIANAEEVAAKKIGIPLKKLQASFGLTFRAEWEILQKLAAAGVNVNFLLLGEGQDYFPPTHIDRVMLAIGTRDPYKLAEIFETEPQEVEQHISETRKHDLVLPRAWAEALQRKYGLCMAWVNSLKYPSHVAIPQPASSTAKADINLPVTHAVSQIESAMLGTGVDANAVWKAIKALVDTKVNQLRQEQPDQSVFLEELESKALRTRTSRDLHEGENDTPSRNGTVAER
jgi:hypothetical protein